MITKRTFILLELTITELGINGLMLEDGPSLLLNGIVLMLNMSAGRKATRSTYASFVSFGFSCFMGGRKMSLPSVRRALLAKKRDLEEVMRKRGWLRGDQDEMKNRPSVGGIFGAMQARPSQIMPLAGNVSAPVISSDSENAVGEFDSKDDGDVRAATGTGYAGEIARLKRELASVRREREDDRKERELAQKWGEELEAENVGLRSRLSRLVADG